MTDMRATERLFNWLHRRPRNDARVAQRTEVEHLADPGFNLQDFIPNGRSRIGVRYPISMPLVRITRVDEDDV